MEHQCVDTWTQPGNTWYHRITTAHALARLYADSAGWVLDGIHLPEIEYYGRVGKEMGAAALLFLVQCCVG